jgi:hypothetical protein
MHLRSRAVTALQDERSALTHHFRFGGHEGYLTVGMYPNGQPGEVFIRMSKEGSTISGLMESFATLLSVSLQHGVPLQVVCEKLAHTRFEPSGWTGNEKMGYAKSIMDYRSACTIRIVCVSDTHFYHQHLDLPDGDILVHAEDFMAFGDLQRHIAEFNEWLGEQPHLHKIVIAGKVRQHV